jgi:transposase InsO family protein
VSAIEIADLVSRAARQGVQYTSIHYTERPAGAGIDLSVGSIGDGNDNALAEAVNGLFKTEVIRWRGPW